MDQGTGPRRGREPRGITLADLMRAVAVLAVGLALEPPRWVATEVMQTCGFVANVAFYTSVYWTLARLALPWAVAVGACILARRVRFGGMPRPAEWLALMTALVLLDPAVEGPDHVGGPIVTRPLTSVTINGAPVPPPRGPPTVLVDLDDGRPHGLVLLSTLGVAGALLLTAWLALRRGLSPGTATLVLTALAWLWLRLPVRLNPVEWVRFRYSYFGLTALPPAAGWSPAQFDWYLEGRLALGRWFVGMLTAVPALSAALALRRRGGAPWRWTEWAGSALAALLAACWAWDELILRPAPGPVVRGTVFVVWLVALGLPAFLVARRFPATTP